MPYLRPFVRTFAAPLLLLMTAVAGGCNINISDDHRPLAAGPEGKITIAIDSVQWIGPIGDAIRETLGGPIYTLPAPEPAFDIQQISIRTDLMFEQMKRQKNVVIVAPLSDTTAEARFLQARFGEGVQGLIDSGESAVVSREDLWRRDQLVVYIAAATPDSVAAAIRAKSEDLLYVFNKITRERLTIEMFQKGRQAEIEERLMEKHGFAVNGQHDYFVAVDTTNFVWLRRVISSETWRSLFVYYEENGQPSDLSAEWIYARRDSLTRQYMQGTEAGYVEIDRRRPLVTENINFLDRYGFETRGLWQMVLDSDGRTLQMGMGGSFVTYAFYDQESGRNYLIDGMIFAPGYEKREFLRQMEVIAHTFRTAPPAAEALATRFE
ncbi:MAG: DUF4837 family protein [Rhodothermales bacterium]|nr:DUF4837 family protein [Rhodothermales bacterium]